VGPPHAALRQDTGRRPCAWTVILSLVDGRVPLDFDRQLERIGSIPRLPQCLLSFLWLRPGSFLRSSYFFSTTSFIFFFFLPPYTATTSPPQTTSPPSSSRFPYARPVASRCCCWVRPRVAVKGEAASARRRRHLPRVGCKSSSRLGRGRSRRERTTRDKGDRGTRVSGTTEAGCV
jgi:hypothetical protein